MGRPCAASCTSRVGEQDEPDQLGPFALGSLDKLVQFKLSDIGEGIAEVQLKDW